MAGEVSPASMAAALETMCEIDGRRRIAVLGPMAELANPEEEHVRIAKLAREKSIQIIAVGTDLYGEPSRDMDQALAELVGLGAGDVVIVKGSRIYELENLVDRLIG